MHNDDSRDDSRLRFAFTNELIARIALDRLSSRDCFGNPGRILVALAEQWGAEPFKTSGTIRYDGDKIPCIETANKNKNRWFVISNGRFATNLSRTCLQELLDRSGDEVVAINVVSNLLAYREKPLITPEKNVVGFRRYYSDSAQPAPMPATWPHHVFIRTDILDKLLVGDELPAGFKEFSAMVRHHSLRMNSFNTAGEVLDLETETGLLRFLTGALEAPKAPGSCIETSAATARFIGEVAAGQNVCVGDYAIVLGPAILGDNVRIADGAVVANSVIGPGVSIEHKEFIRDRIVTDQQQYERLIETNSVANHKRQSVHYFNRPGDGDIFRKWPRFSYPRFFKRICDIIGAAVTLVLLAPIFLVIGIVIKLNSPGPVFYRARCQGSGGRKINCIKFRTMIASAEKMQDNLRIVNEVDGPQFKMENDPRVNAVGRFLRQTSIDEIPQFINVLLGQMSIAGPRPSPAKENSLCPPWRDARLSVRPGITGLWQISRTRDMSKDFQEWLYYDTRYVRELSFALDLKICFKTATKLINDFVDQF